MFYGLKRLFFQKLQRRQKALACAEDEDQRFADAFAVLVRSRMSEEETNDDDESCKVIKRPRWRSRLVSDFSNITFSFTGGRITFLAEYIF